MELYPFSIDFQSDKLFHSYGDYSKGIFRENIYSSDEKGVFIFEHNTIVYYNPCAIAEYALILFAKLVESNYGDSHLKREFSNQVDWLLNNYTDISPNSVAWIYKYPNQKPFISGISQGMIISVLLRSYQLFQEKEHLDLAWKSYNLLITKLENGGLLDDTAPFDFWFEEHIESPKILNGHIYALLGIYDLYRVTRKPDVKISFDKGCESIKKNIKMFDLGFFTKYDAFSKYPANNSYHYTHITLFKILFLITKDDFFNKYAIKFHKYHTLYVYKFINLFYLIGLTLMSKVSNKKLY